MNGIERLRKVAGLFYGPTMSSALANDLNDIADQIEREHVSRMRVLAVVTEMERLLSGHEVRGNNPVSRWARELREAMDAGRDPAGDVSVSAYDLLPEEEREAIAWIERHGGLEAVEARWSERVSLSTVKTMVERHRAKRERLKAHALFLESKCRERQRRIVELNRLNRAYVDALNGVCERLGLTDGTGLPDMPEVIWAELDRRLMPDGYEWPRWDDGSPVMLSEGQGEDVVRTVAFNFHTAFIDFKSPYVVVEPLIMETSATRYLDMGQSLERPAPKVLDADGTEIRVGDTVWHVLGEFGPRVVSKFETHDGKPVAVFEPNGSDLIGCECDQLTHRAPVLAADGRPLRDGETVWLTVGSERHVVLSTEKDAVGNIVTEVQAPGAIKVHISPSRLTHERPDSFELIEQDVELCPHDYAQKYNKPSGMSSAKFQRTDLVRRAKALAERGRR